MVRQLLQQFSYLQAYPAMVSDSEMMLLQALHGKMMPQLSGALICRHGYLSSLPHREYVPMFWAQEEVDILQGTDAAVKPEQDRWLA